MCLSGCLGLFCLSIQSWYQGVGICQQGAKKAGTAQGNLNPIIGPCGAFASCHHLFNGLPLGQCGRVDRLTGDRTVERDHRMPAQVKRGGKLEPIRQPRCKTRSAGSKRDGLGQGLTELAGEPFGEHLRVLFDQADQLAEFRRVGFGRPQQVLIRSAA